MDINNIGEVTLIIVDNQRKFTIYSEGGQVTFYIALDDAREELLTEQCTGGVKQDAVTFASSEAAIAFLRKKSLITAKFSTV